MAMATVFDPRYGDTLPSDLIPGTDMIAESRHAVPEIKSAVPRSKRLRTSRQRMPYPGSKLPYLESTSGFAMSRIFKRLPERQRFLTVLDKFLTFSHQQLVPACNGLVF